MLRMKCRVAVALVGIASLLQAAGGVPLREAKVSVFASFVRDIANVRSVSLSAAADLLYDLGVRGFDTSVNDRDLAALVATKLKPVNLYFVLKSSEAERVALETAARYGVSRLMVIPPNFTSDGNAEAEFRRTTERLRAFVAAAKARGVTVMVEDFGNTSNPCSHLAYLKRFLDAIPDLRLALDSGNLFYAGRGENILDLLAYAPGRIAHVHLKDQTPADSRVYATLGQGAVPNRQIVQELRAIGYDGWWTLEEAVGDAYADTARQMTMLKSWLDVATPVAYEDAFIDRMWLWGHLSGQVDGTNNLYRLDVAKGDYSMSAALKELGLRNLNIIRWDRPSLEQLQEFKDVKRLTLPGAAHDAEGVKDYSLLHDHVFAAATAMDNVVGIELDDYYRSRRTNSVMTVTATRARPTCPAAFGPEMLADLRTRADRFQRPLDIRLVVYDDLFTERADPRDIIPAIDQATAVTFWTWKAENLKKLRENFAFYRKLAPTKPTFLGLYLYDFGGAREMTAAEMRCQLDFALEKFRAGEIEGVVFLCSSIVNRDFEAIRLAKDWIRKNAQVRRL